MAKKVVIEQRYSNSVVNIVLDTLKMQKQALVFVNSKPSAESEAERMSSKTKIQDERLIELSDKILNALDKPTRQCQRLASCVKGGVAFHHSGLHSKQRELVETAFREGTLKVICATPTLAYGLNLPAFRVIVRDLKRFTAPRGMTPIPVLEYLQFCGRAGRPDFGEEHGEAICIAQTTSEKENIIDTYIHGVPEDILSKLAVEPVLRTYILSLVAMEFCTTQEALLEFFDQTFYAHQFGKLERLEAIVLRMLSYLEEWGFVVLGDKIHATALGKRVSELYVDPYTANYIITCLKRSSQSLVQDYSFLQMVAYTLEMRPLLTIRVSEFEIIERKSAEWGAGLWSLEPSMFEPEYEEYLRSIKTAMFMHDWINEVDEEQLLESYNIRPGEIRAKLESADWLLYASSEFCKLTKNHSLVSEIAKLRVRIKHGAKLELLPLLVLEGIGRVRARKLYREGFKTLSDIRKGEPTRLSKAIGKALALSVKKQVGVAKPDSELDIL